MKRKKLCRKLQVCFCLVLLLIGFEVVTVCAEPIKVTATKEGNDAPRIMPGYTYSVTCKSAQGKLIFVAPFDGIYSFVGSDLKIKGEKAKKSYNLIEAIFLSEEDIAKSKTDPDYVYYTDFDRIYGIGKGSKKIKLSKDSLFSIGTPKYCSGKENMSYKKKRRVYKKCEGRIKAKAGEAYYFVMNAWEPLKKGYTFKLSINMVNSL